MSLNTVNILGNLTRNPEFKQSSSGKTLCILCLASNHTYLKNNEKVSEVYYFDIEVWGTYADNCSKYLSKGSGIIVEGRLVQDRWEKDGKTNSRIKIIAGAIHFLPKRQINAAESDVPSQESYEEVPLE